MREKINSEHRIRGLMERSLNCADKLVVLYEDKDGYNIDTIYYTASIYTCVVFHPSSARDRKKWLN